jgi:hypothetical protein
MPKDEALVTIATFETELEASLARGALAACRRLPSETGGAFGGLYSGIGLGPAELKVLLVTMPTECRGCSDIPLQELWLSKVDSKTRPLGFRRPPATLRDPCY